MEGKGIRVFIGGKPVVVGTNVNFSIEAEKPEHVDISPVPHSVSWDCATNIDRSYYLEKHLVESIEDSVNKQLQKIIIEFAVKRVPRKIKKEMRKYDAGLQLTKMRKRMYRMFRKNRKVIEGDIRYEFSPGEKVTTITMSIDNAIINNTL